MSFIYFAAKRKLPRLSCFKFTFIPVLLIVLLLPSPASASPLKAPPIIITEGENKYLIGSHMDILEDPDKQWTIEEITAEPLSSKFAPYGKKVPSLGRTSSAFWYRTQVRNSTKVLQRLILEEEIPFVDLMEIYIAKPGGGYKTIRAGDTLPFYEREIIHPDFLFKLKIKPEETLSLFIRVQSSGALLTPFTFWKEEAFGRHDRDRGHYFGVFFGGLFVVLFYNLFLFLSLKDKVYLYYVSYISSLALFAFSYNGFCYQYFWPGSPWWANWNNVFSMALFQFFGVLFTKEFLETRKNLPGIDRVLKALLLYFALLIISPVLNLSYDLMIFLSAASVQIFRPALLVVGLIAWRKGNRSARFFLCAWIASSTGSVITSMTFMGIIPYRFILFHAGELGSFADVTLLSLALADKINILRREKEEAQQLTRATLEKARDELEEKVEERTIQIKKTNKQLKEEINERTEVEKKLLNTLNDLKENEITLKNAKKKAEDATKLKDSFVSLVSHDLRSPLGTVIGLFDILQSGLKNSLDKTQKNIATRITENITGLVKMIDQLLNISRLQTGKIRPNPSFFDGHPLILLSIQHIAHMAKIKEVEIINEIKPDTRFYGDEVLLGEVVNNLLSNAIKFCSAGEKVTIFTPESKDLTIAVQDTGKGISEKILPDIFKHEVKTTTKGTAGEKGTGLGLPFCKDIIEVHGGTLRVESSADSGTVFYADLPNVRPLVLLVDDSKHKRIAFGAYLRKIDAEVIESENGAEAIAKLKECKPHLLVTDIQMPVMDGFELLKYVRANLETKNLPVIVITADESIETREKAFQLGANDFVTASTSSNEFIPRVRRTLRTKRNLPL